MIYLCICFGSCYKYIWVAHFYFYCMYIVIYIYILVSVCTYLCPFRNMTSCHDDIFQGRVCFFLTHQHIRILPHSAPLWGIMRYPKSPCVRRLKWSNVGWFGATPFWETEKIGTVSSCATGKKGSKDNRPGPASNHWIGSSWWCLWCSQCACV